MELYNNKLFRMGIDLLYRSTFYSTFTVTVFSDAFSGKCSFSLSKESINQVIDDLKRMEFQDNAEVRFSDCESDSFILLRKQSRKVFINGQIGGTHRDNYMVFKNTADNSITYLLYQFLSQWKN